jgi:hypothetical protein
MQTVIETVFAARDCHGTSKTELPREGGLFGRTRGFFGVVEAQGRGSLHAHLVLWGPSVARMISDATASGSEARLNEVKKYVDSVTSTSAPSKEAVDALPKGYRPGLATTPDIDDEASNEELLTGATLMMNHVHHINCFKYVTTHVAATRTPGLNTDREFTS